MLSTYYIPPFIRQTQRKQDKKEKQKQAECPSTEPCTVTVADDITPYMCGGLRVRRKLRTKNIAGNPNNQQRCGQCGDYCGQNGHNHSSSKCLVNSEQVVREGSLDLSIFDGHACVDLHGWRIEQPVASDILDWTIFIDDVSGASQRDHPGVLQVSVAEDLCSHTNTFPNAGMPLNNQQGGEAKASNGCESEKRRAHKRMDSAIGNETYDEADGVRLYISTKIDSTIDNNLNNLAWGEHIDRSGSPKINAKTDSVDESSSATEPAKDASILTVYSHSIETGELSERPNGDSIYRIASTVPDKSSGSTCALTRSSCKQNIEKVKSKPRLITRFKLFLRDLLGERRSTPDPYAQAEFDSDDWFLYKSVAIPEEIMDRALAKDAKELELTPYERNMKQAQGQERKLRLWDVMEFLKRSCDELQNLETARWDHWVRWNPDGLSNCKGGTPMCGLIVPPGWMCELEEIDGRGSDTVPIYDFRWSVPKLARNCNVMSNKTLDC